jgi:hypothetical protein
MDSEISFEIYTLRNPSKDPFDIVYNNKIFRTIPPNKAMRLPKKPFGELAEKHLIDRMVQQEGLQINDQQARAKWRAIIVMDEDKDLSDVPLDPEEILKRKLDLLNSTNESEAVQTCESCGVKTFNLNEHNMLNHAGNLAPVEPVAPVLPPVEQVVAPVAPVAPAYVAPVTPQAPAQEVITPESVAAQSVEVIDTNSPEVLPPQQHHEPQNDQERRRQNLLSGAVGADEDKKEAYVLPEQTVEEVEAPAAPQQLPPPTRESLIAYARDELKMNVEDAQTKAILDTKPVEELALELGYGQ